MRIVVDLQACQNGSRHRGIGRYALAITRAMIAQGRGHEWRILLSDAFPGTIAPIRRALAELLPQEHIHVCAMPGHAASANPANAWRTRAAELVRGAFIEALAPDLLFVPSLFEGYHDAMVVSVERGAWRTAVTLFDFIPLEYPDQYLPGEAIRLAYHRKLAEARKADLLLPISHYVAEQAAARLGGAAGRIITVPLGVEPMFRPASPEAADRAALMRRYAIDRPFVLNTSPLEHRKNIPGLIAGFAALPRALRDAHRLVIVGGMDKGARSRIAALAVRAGLPDDAVVLPGFVPDEDLVALYGHCALFAFPSISEGFGLPVLEAMACGAAVVGSATTSIPEVIGRADLLFDPEDPQAIAAAMARVLGDPALAAELRAHGPERAAGFTWERAAETMLHAFESLDPPSAPAPARSAPPPDRLAVVVQSIAGEGPLGRYLADLLPALALAREVTLVCAEGRIADMALAASVDVRDFAWFERHSARFGPPLYVRDADETPAMATLMALIPGLLLRLEAVAPAQASGLARRADPGSAQIAFLRGGGADMLARETLIARADADARDEAARIIAAFDRHAAAPLPDLARTFAARLPAQVREVRPSSDDLSRLASALAHNEAQVRSPLILLDLTAFTPAEAPAAATHLLAAFLQRGGEDVRFVRAVGDRCMTAGQRLGEALGHAGALPPDEPFALRPGDRLLGCDLLGGFGAECLPALHGAEDAGVGLRLVTIGAGNDQPADALAALMLDWATVHPVTTERHVGRSASPYGTPETALPAAFAVLAESALAFDMLLLDAATDR